jgi:hypothetical protein
MSDQPELKAFWSRFPDLLHQPRWQQLQAQIRLMQVPAGASLFHTGDLCQHYVVVLNGSVAVRRFAENGRESCCTVSARANLRADHILPAGGRSLSGRRFR